LLRKYFENLI